MILTIHLINVVHCMLFYVITIDSQCIPRGNFVYAASQWETTLQCNVISYRLGTYRKRSLTPIPTQIAKFMGPTWGPPGSRWHQMGPMLALWTLLSGQAVPGQRAAITATGIPTKMMCMAAQEIVYGMILLHEQGTWTGVILYRSTWIITSHTESAVTICSYRESTEALGPSVHIMNEIPLIHVDEMIW